jgi:hypothetical protein
MHPRIALALAALALAACGRQPPVIVETAPPTPLPVARTQTLETHALKKEIDAFAERPSLAQSARVDQAFAEIDGEIAELAEHAAKRSSEDRAEAARKLADLRAYRTSEHVRFLRLQAKAELQEKRGAVEPPAVPPSPSTEKLGDKIDDAARNTDDALRDAADALRENTRGS